MNNLPYRYGVGIALVNESNQVFTAKRIDMISEAWQMPQGGIDEGEDPLIAAYRELEEETNVKSVDLIYESKDWFYYDLPENLIPKIWGGKYRGQKQKWFLMRIKDQAEININTKNPEFSEWRWTNIDELPDVIVDFKKDLYTKIVAEFKEVLLG